ncbi:MAG: outer membrane beta-barrel protein [Prevotella sp.]|nr:outer membrane beta-barrel protein [Prevotella sp.]
MQQKLADYEMPAPELSWAQIEEAVAANRQTAKTIPLWLRRIAAAVVVLLVVGAGYQAFFAEQTNTDKPKEIAANVAKRKTSTSETENSTKNPETSMEKAEKLMTKAEKTTKKAEASTKEPETSTKQTEISNSVKSNQESEKTTSEIEKPTKKTEKSTRETNPRYQPSPFIAQDHHTNKKTTSTGSRLTAKLYLSNGMADKGADTAVDTLTDPSTTGPMIGPPGDDDEEPKIYDNIYHRQPIRFGLSVNYRIADRWSIESGIVYTRLSSTYTYQPFDFFFVKADQRLTYLGIPLKVNHQLWAYRRFNVYASLGGMAEKMLKGSRTYDVGFDQPIVEESIKIKPLQFSLNGAVGAEYRLADHFSIYAEPELNYYFKDSSIDVPTFYQDKPLNFSFSIGLRMNLR